MATQQNSPKPNPPPLPTTDLSKIFAKFDQNHDGKITTPELRSLISSLGPAPTDAELSLMMKEMDTNNNGSVDIKEFIEFYTRSHGNQEEEGKELKEAFDVYDKDRDGLISPRELQDVMVRLGEGASLRECEGMIGKVDGDGDGCVSFEEFKKMMA